MFSLNNRGPLFQNIIALASITILVIILFLSSCKQIDKTPGLELDYSSNSQYYIWRAIDRQLGIVCYIQSQAGGYIGISCLHLKQEKN